MLAATASRLRALLLVGLPLLLLGSCNVGGGGNLEVTRFRPTVEPPPPPPPPPVEPQGCSFSVAGAAPPSAAHTLRINEVMTGNDGAWVDEAGETDDFVELLNTGEEPLRLAHFALGDRLGQATPLPNIELAPDATVLFWADDEPEQGILHLPFKLSSSGTPVLLWAESCELVDVVEVPPLPRSESYARIPDGDGELTLCRYATPERHNGDRCEPPPPPNLRDDVTFAQFEWPAPHPPVAGPLMLVELALRPAAFIEVQNTSDAEVTLKGFHLRLAALAPGEPWPAEGSGKELPWPDSVTALAPGERLQVPLVAADTTELEANVDFEGVASVWRSGATQPSDRLDFMAWPEGAALVRSPAAPAPRFCKAPTPDEDDGCEELGERTLPHGRAHHLATPSDFATLARGGTTVGQAGVKFVVDMDAGDRVHLLGTRDWALHYSWVREAIELLPRLDRCDPAQAQEFNRGWITFSQEQYYRAVGRRYLLGTLVQHTNGSKTIEFTPGDVITGEQMRRAFFAVTARVADPENWAVRPSEARQIEELREVEGTLPVVGPNAPFVDLRYQSLNPAVGYGTLVFVPAHELERAELGPNVIVVTDDVPNETAFMGGLVTEAFQTPLAHVNVLARGRGTPNMALRDARSDPRVAPLFGKLVRLEVRATDFSLREATAAEADAYYRARAPSGPKLEPAADLTVRGVIALEGARFDVGNAAGSKAAGLAELYRVSEVGTYCTRASALPYVPPQAFAIPFAHYAEHFEASGAAALLAKLEQDPKFRADPTRHAQGLAELRQLLLEHPVDPDLLDEVATSMSERFGARRVRFRSSSNTEDLATFNGAGLHASTSADLEGSSSTVEAALREVWASLWNTRAYDEREFGNVEQARAAMAVLVHEAFQSEAAQGVAISRNALDAIRSSQYYINAQVGEASVTNPAPGVTSDELVYTPPPRRPKVEYHSRSSLSRGLSVLSFAEIQALGCVLEAVHEHYRPLVDPQQSNRLYAMQIEWKLIGPERRLLVKQARPYGFGVIDAPVDCREL